MTHPINERRHAVDAWIDAIPDNPYAPCPCGCGMKWRFALKDGIDKHEQRFLAAHTGEAHDERKST